MRVLVGILGTLFVLIGLAMGVTGAITLGVTDGDHSGDSWTCSAPSTGATQCDFDYDSNPNDNQVGTTAATMLTIGGAAFFVGGCALLGGAAAGSGRKQQAAPQYQPQPVTTGGPPSYGGGAWQQTAQQPPNGPDQPRS